MKDICRYLVFLVILTGCAGQDRFFIPDHARTDPAQAVAVEHPVKLEKSVKSITTFITVMDAGLWTEVVYIGGVWPVLALTADEQLIPGYAYMLPAINYWGDFLIRFVFRDVDLKNARILMFNRDAGMIYDLTGKEHQYNPEDFEKDPEYRREVFFSEENGNNTLQGIGKSWQNYFAEIDIPTEYKVKMIEKLSPRKILVGSPQWTKFRNELSGHMPYNYKISGEIYCGYFPVDTFRQMAVEIPGFTGSQRFVKRAKIPLAVLPFTEIGMLTSVAINLGTSVVMANVDTNIHWFYNRATTLRYQMAPMFRQMSKMYKTLLEQRDREIKMLRNQLLNR